MRQTLLALDVAARRRMLHAHVERNGHILANVIVRRPKQIDKQFDAVMKLGKVSQVVVALRQIAKRSAHLIVHALTVAASQ